MAASDHQLDLDEGLESHEHQDGRQPLVVSVTGTVSAEAASLLLFEDMARYVDVEMIAGEARSSVQYLVSRVLKCCAPVGSDLKGYPKLLLQKSSDILLWQSSMPAM